MKQASPTAIGGFVVSAVGLGVAGVLMLTDVAAEQTYDFVAYFDSSVAGLDEGAPVRFKGVKVGEVYDISAKFDPATENIEIPVHLKYYVGSILLPQDDEVREEEFHAYLQHLIRRGLRAQLRQESFITGKLYVELAFFDDPDKVKPEDTVQGRLPTQSSGLDLQTLRLNDLIEKINRLEVEKVIDNLNQALETFDSEMAPLARKATETLDEIDGLVADVRTELEALSQSARDTLGEARGTFGDARATLGDVRGLTVNVDAKVAPLVDSLLALSDSAQAALGEAREALARVNEGLGDDYTLLYRVATLLDEITVAARSISVLAADLQQHPEALFSGKE